MTDKTYAYKLPDKYSPANGAIYVDFGTLGGFNPFTLKDFRYKLQVIPVVAEYITQSSVSPLNFPPSAKQFTGKFNGNSYQVNPNPYSGAYDISTILKTYTTSNILNLASSTVLADNYGIVKYNLLEGYQHSLSVRVLSYRVATATNNDKFLIFKYDTTNYTFGSSIYDGNFDITFSKDIKNIDPYMDTEYYIADALHPGIVFNSDEVGIRYSQRIGGVDVILYDPPSQTDMGYFTFIRRRPTLINNNSYYAWNAVRQYADKDKNFADRYLIRDANAVGTVPTKGLTIHDEYKDIKINDYEFVNFLMDQATYPVTHIQIVTYNNNKNVIGSVTLPMTVVDPANKFWTLPTGPLNITAMGASQSALINNTSVVYYEVSLKYIQTSPFPIDITRMIIKRKINRECYKYEPVRLAWLNELGGWEFYTFNAANKFTTSVKKTEYNQSLTHNYTVGDRADNTLAVDITETYTANTEYISKYDYDYLKSLVKSPQVYYINKNIENGLYSYGEPITPSSSNINIRYLPVKITSTSYESKSLYNEQVFQLGIQYEFAFDIRAQSE